MTIYLTIALILIDEKGWKSGVQLISRSSLSLC